MAQLAGADAGYEDASGYTASSPFLYNSSVFGQNIPFTGSGSTEPASMGTESYVLKRNPYNRVSADGSNAGIKREATTVYLGNLASGYTLNRPNPYNRNLDGANNAIKSSVENSSDSTGRRKTKLRYVWGNHNVST